MRTEELLKQSSLAEELQSQQNELRETNQRLEQQAKSLRASEELLKNQQEQLQQTNTELEERSELLALQNQEVERRIGRLNRLDGLWRKSRAIDPYFALQGFLQHVPRAQDTAEQPVNPGEAAFQ